MNNRQLEGVGLARRSNEAGVVKQNVTLDSASPPAWGSDSGVLDDTNDMWCFSGFRARVSLQPLTYVAGSNIVLTTLN